MLEAYLIKHCAPTLASLKTAGLFRISFSSEEDLLEQFAQWNDVLGEKGVSLRLFQKQEETALIYVYRKDLPLRLKGQELWLLVPDLKVLKLIFSAQLACSQTG